MDTGESTKISVNTIAQGRPDVSVEPVVINSCASFTAHEAAGAASARSSLRPLLDEGTWFLPKPRTHRVAGMQSCDSNRFVAHPSRRRASAAPQDEVVRRSTISAPHGEELRSSDSNHEAQPGLFEN